MHRFAVVKHDWSNKFGRVPIHHLLGEYHWASLDEGHVLLLGYVHPPRIMTLDKHPDCLLMPSLFSTKTVFAHAEERQKSHFCLPLVMHMSLQPHHQVMHLAEIAHAMHGKIFALDV